MTRKYDDSAIDSHATMNRYASSASSTSAIAARNTWYWKQMRPGARALARCGSSRRRTVEIAAPHGAEQQQEERRQRVEAQVKRQVGQAQRQDERLRRRADGRDGDDGEHQADDGAGREQQRG